jgi:YidC/Oxa1 family membrane protein insertase
MHPTSRFRIASLVLALGLTSAAVYPEHSQAMTDRQTIVVAGNSVRIGFSPFDGRPVSWQSCDPACDTQPADAVLKTIFFSPEDADKLRGPFFFEATGASRSAGGPLLSSAIQQADGVTIVEFRNRLAGTAGFLLQRYEIPDDGYVVRYHAETRETAGSPVTLAYRISTGEEFAPRPMPGFSSGYAKVRPAILFDGQQISDEETAGQSTLQASSWAGVRSRFWAILGRIPAGGVVTIDRDRSAVLISGTDDSTGLDLEFYSGPVANNQLRAAGNGLSALLFSHIWVWLRPLCYGLMAILSALLSLVGNAGLAIMLLSVVVKILMYPLTRLAENWQAQVNRIHSRLQPALEKAKEGYKGEERHERVLAVYRRQGVHPLYTMKSLFGYLIQIPVFIAAFAMLGENIALAEIPWLWISDLSRPDALFSLPADIPFFGSEFNLLPLIMSSLSVLAAHAHKDPHLTPALLASQKRRLYFLSALFFVLFYTFPAGMVLYWTTNNLLHLVASRFGASRSGQAT